MSIEKFENLRTMVPYNVAQLILGNPGVKHSVSHFLSMKGEKHSALDLHRVYRKFTNEWKETECFTPGLSRTHQWTERNGLLYTWVTEDSSINGQGGNALHLVYRGFINEWTETEFFTPGKPRIQQ